MKKLIFMAVAIAAMTFASCGNKSNNVQAEADSTTVETLEESTLAFADSLTNLVNQSVEAKDGKQIEGVLAQLQAKYAELVQAGKLEEAKAYASKVQEFINEHADAIKSAVNGNTTISSLVDGIASLPTSASATAEEAAAAVKSDVMDIANSAKENAENAVKEAVDEQVDAAKEAVNDAANKAVDAAKSKVNDAQQKAADKVNDAKQKANDAVNNAANKALKGIGL